MTESIPPLPPRRFAWQKTLKQTHVSTRQRCLVSGSSFTYGTNQTNFAASWPGYLYERCNLEQVIDLSYPEMNNNYIANSIIEYLQSMTAEEKNQTFVVVMWNGVFRSTSVRHANNNKNWPMCKGKSFDPYQNIDSLDKDFQRICDTALYLIKENIPYAFSFYANILFAPLLPTPDELDKFYKNITEGEIQQLQSFNLIPKNKRSYLYDYTFFKGEFDFCKYHPDKQTRMNWTDQVLLPELEWLGLINKT